MDFSLNDEQRMLADLVGRFVDKDYGFEARKAAMAAPEGFSRQHWGTLAETGLLGLNVPEAQGGRGGSAIETFVVMEALGRGLVVEPFVHNAVVAARLLSQAAPSARQEQMLSALIAGEHLSALAVLEPRGRYDLWSVETRARREEGGWRLDGAKCTVHYGDSADTLIVSARTSGEAGDREGISLFLVDRVAAGVSVQGFSSFDGQRVAEVRLDGVQVASDALVGPVGEGHALLEQAIDRGLAALCAEAVGAMQQLMDLTAEYLRTRKQFGKPIGSFQALQHRAADMVIWLEQARSAALMAAAHADDADAVERRRAISAAKSLVGRCGRRMGETATQLHGGMGVTDEMLSGHYYKRLVGIDKTWGDCEHHAELFAQVMA